MCYFKQNHVEKNFTQEWFMPSLVEIGSVALEKVMTL